MDQWSAGLRRLEEVPRARRPVIDRVVRRVEAELRRRLGGAFSVQELVDFYDQGTGWVSDLAFASAPDDPDAWDVRVVGDAAFGLYVRGAVDWAGGKRI